MVEIVSAGDNTQAENGIEIYYTQNAHWELVHILAAKPMVL